MDIVVKLAAADDLFILKNFVPHFRHYVAKVYDEMPNQYGVFAYDQSRNYQEFCQRFDIWVNKPGELFPFIIYYESCPVGYLLASKVRPEAFEKSDYFVNALFVSSPVRRKGIASTAVKTVFDMFPGKWELHTASSERNAPTQYFWRKTLGQYTKGNFEDFTAMTPDGSEKIIFRFYSSPKSL